MACLTNSCIEYLTAFGTIATVIVALFKDEIKNFFWKPKADIEFNYKYLNYFKNNKINMFIRVANKTRALKYPLREATLYLTSLIDVTDDNQPEALISIPTPLAYWDYDNTNVSEFITETNINAYAYIKFCEFQSTNCGRICSSVHSKITIASGKKYKIGFMIDANNFVSKDITYILEWKKGFQNNDLDIDKNIIFKRIT